MINDTNIEVVTVESFSQLANLYAEFEKEYGSPTIFNSFKWLQPWLDNYWQPEWRLSAFAIYCDKKLVCIAPFYIQQSLTFPYLKTLHLIGQGEPESAEVASEYLDILVIEEYKKIVFARLLNEIKSLKFDIVSANALLSNAYFLSIISTLSNKAEQRNSLRYLVDVNKWSFDQLSKNSRTRLKRAKNQLTALNAEIKWLDHSEKLQYWPYLIGFHQDRWQQKGALGAFEQESFKSFHQSFINNHPDTIEMSAIFVKNKPIAINYYIVAKNTYHFYQSGWDEQHYAKVSPGFYLHFWSIKHCPSMFYDFMMGGGRGSYKAKFNCIQEDMKSIKIIINTKKYFLKKLFSKIKNKLTSIRSNN